jgi:hypothetical protein
MKISALTTSPACFMKSFSIPHVIEKSKFETNTLAHYLFDGVDLDSALLLFAGGDADLSSFYQLCFFYTADTIGYDYVVVSAPPSPKLS